MIKHITYVVVGTAASLLLTSPPARSSEYRGLYPMCTPVAHEIQEAWIRGEVTRREADQIIRNCLKWEEGHRA